MKTSAASQQCYGFRLPLIFSRPRQGIDEQTLVVGPHVLPLGVVEESSANPNWEDMSPSVVHFAKASPNGRSEYDNSLSVLHNRRLEARNRFGMGKNHEREGDEVDLTNKQLEIVFCRSYAFRYCALSATPAMATARDKIEVVVRTRDGLLDGGLRTLAATSMMAASGRSPSFKVGAR